jgi:hypothetical protein
MSRKKFTTEAARWARDARRAARAQRFAQKKRKRVELF